MPHEESGARRSAVPAGARFGAAPSESTSSDPLRSTDGIDSAVTSALESWDDDGQEILRTTLVAGDDTGSKTYEASRATIIQTQAVLRLLESSLNADQLAAFFGSCLESLASDDRRDALGEVIVDVVEVLEQEREDLAEARKEQGMEVDEQGSEAGVKGMEVVKALIGAGTLAKHIPNLLLSPERLLALDLHPFPQNPAALQRAYVKRNTTLFFKQSKYNLLRESSEGFSALIVLLTGSDTLCSSPQAEAAEDLRERARRVWGKVMSLIGYFNLSPPRVLDLILEIASCHVAAHWRFWIELIACSPWGETGGSRSRKGKEKASAGWVNAEVAEISEALDQRGDRVLAQVLGVKFSFCQRQDGGDTPVGLTYIAALLVKHGFVALSDLLPFLSPDDAGMDALHTKFQASVSTSASKSNALTRAVLIDEDAPASASGTAEPAAPPPKPPPEQRIQLLQALLSLGDLTSSLFLLGRYPWLAQRHPQIADMIMRIVAHALQGVYDNNMASRGGIDDMELELDAPAPTFRLLKKQVIPSLMNPPPPDTPSKAFEFFYPAWRDELEIWTRVEDIRERGLRWLGLVRGLAARDVVTVVEICRLGAAHFAGLKKEKEALLGFQHPAKSKEEMALVQPTEQEMEPWMDIIRSCLLPALSASTATASFDLELWALLRYFPYAVRYCLYGEWRDRTCKAGHAQACPAAAQASFAVADETKKALRRVTAPSSSAPGGAAVVDRGPARAMAKSSHSNPAALWAEAISQVRAYTNIGQHIVEAGRYMTQLAMDVAVFTLVDSLSQEGQQAITEVGSVAQWLENLSAFSGDLNRRYYQMDLEPVLQFIINRLMRGESNDLTILESLISIMSGSTKIDNDAISDDQLKAYASGREMLREAFNQTSLSVARPPDSLDPGQKAKVAPVDKTKSTKKSLPRLINALRETGLALPIWIALAQTRQGSVDRMADAPIKAMSARQDTVHDIFIQYGDLLAEQLSGEEHIAKIPDLVALVSDFHLDYAMAFQILRPKLKAEFDKIRSDEKAAVQKRLMAEKMVLNAKLNSPTSATTPLPASPTASTAEGEDETMQDPNGVAAEEDVKMADPSAIPPPRAVRQRVWWPTALTTTMQQARDLLPADANSVMSAAFFVIFWHLTMPDIAFSSDSYKKAIDKINALEKDVSGWRYIPKATAVQESEQKAERARLRSRAEILSKERDAQSALVNGPMRRRLRAESARWFGKSIEENNMQGVLSTQLHQYCFYPRALLTPSDAVFVAKFIRTAHDLGTPSFSTLFAYRNFFNDRLAACIFSCTENEARNLGRCLAAIMADLDAWHADEARYKREGQGLPDAPKDAKDDGEGQKPAAQPLPGMQARIRPGEPMRPMVWTGFRNLYVKFHNTLAKALVSCFKESDFMHIKNAVTVGLQVLKSFPVMETNGSEIEAAIEKLVKDGDMTADLQHQCQAYLRQLKKRQDTKPYVTQIAFSGSFASAKAATTTSVTASKDAPKAPRATSTADAGVTNGEKLTGGTASDPKILRQKLEEQRSARTATIASESRTAPSSPARDSSDAGSKTDVDRDSNTNAAPSGPRATRSSASVPPSSTSERESKPAVDGDAKPSGPPTGPSRQASGSSGLPQRPQTTASSSTMGPPTTLSVDEERAAARARKFGTLAPAKGSTPPATPSASGAASASQDTKPAPSGPASDRRGKSPTPTSRRGSPAPAASRLQRSGSVDSKSSQPSRRDTREREKDDKDRDDRRSTRRGDDDRRSGSGRGRDAVDEKSSQPKQDRDDTPAVDSASGNRSSRDGRRRDERESDRRRDRERDDRRGSRSSRSDRDRDGRDKKPADGSKDDKERERDGKQAEETVESKRKRDDEPPRRIDPVGREDRRDRDRTADDRGSHRREHDRRDDRRSDRRDDDRNRDDRRGGDSRHGDSRDDRDRRRPGDAPARDSHDNRNGPAPRDEPRRRSPDRRGGRSSHGGPASADANAGDRTPKKDSTANSGKELLPSTPAPTGAPASDRIIDDPRSSRGRPTGDSNRPGGQGRAPPSGPSTPANGGGRTPHGLPARPGSAAGSAGGGASLASRLAPSSGNGNDDRGNNGGDARKRAFEEAGPAAREGSPGEAKRVKINRDGAKRAPGGRLLSSAMDAATDK